MAVVSFANKLYERINFHGENFGDLVMVGRVPPRARIGAVYSVLVHRCEIRGMTTLSCMPKSRAFSDEPIATVRFSVNPTLFSGRHFEECDVVVRFSRRKSFFGEACVHLRYFSGVLLIARKVLSLLIPSYRLPTKKSWRCILVGIRDDHVQCVWLAIRNNHARSEESSFIPVRESRDSKHI